ncbi:glycosyltransferase family 4 protein [Polynucleobacter sp. AP-Sving-400A-A2]|uniref:glycosyltransferase family 4 protein n=1 Tax=Polynucleobacter sp. AP-Sving-400A-A2 TaxID=2081049 RepID=UPI001BFE2310|nr:glycosyltransferase family 4 protein [Polynucleobacter sp. AP-Sving-400A-A2]QWE14865.1 glycosyltransferase family 4 protein [Polynucleobacter sp. AP-Sving-400A-A2]
MTKAPIVTWQVVLTDHQAFTYEALADSAGVKVLSHVVVLEDEARKKQGWLDLQVKSLSRFLIPRNNFFKYCFGVIRDHQNSIHIFAAPFSDWRFIPCMLYAAWLNVEYFIISEPYSPESEGYLSDTSLVMGQIKALLRPKLYRLYGLLLRRSVTGIFAISRLALFQFQVLGFPASKLFPFGYFVPGQFGSKDEERFRLHRQPHSSINAIFVGSLIRRKGVDLLIDVSKALLARGSRISIDVYGPESKDMPLLNFPNLSYKGAIPFGMAQKEMAQYDLVIVPSRHDGWGVAVNEAILAGTPVVCSDQVGAGTLVNKFACGLEFKSGDHHALLEILRKIEDDPELLNSLSERAISNRERIEPKIAAKYMLSVFESSPSRRAMIDSPWY